MRAQQLRAVPAAFLQRRDMAETAEGRFLRIAQDTGVPGGRALRGEKCGDLCKPRFVRRVHVHACGAVGMNIDKAGNQSFAAAVDGSRAGSSQPGADSRYLSLNAKHLRRAKGSIPIDQRVFQKQLIHGSPQKGCAAAVWFT